VRRLEEIRPVAILHTPPARPSSTSGRHGRLGASERTRRRGATVTLRHAEVLDKAGNFYTANLRGASQKIEYTLKGDAEETYEPHSRSRGSVTSPCRAILADSRSIG